MTVSDEQDGRHPDDLLPWYVNGTLEEAERREVETHLGGCERCRAEVEWLRALHQGVKASQAVEPPGELGLKRLQREVRRQSRPAVSRWWRPAFAAAALALVVQSAVLVRVTGPPGDVLQPLGGDAGTGALQVTFAPDAPEHRIRELLNAIDAEIVAGPGAIGVYRLRVEGGAEALREARAELEAHPTVVTHVSRREGP